MDVGHALLNLQADLQIDSAAVAGTSPPLAEAVGAAKHGDEDPTLWYVGTRALILELMRFDVPEDMDAEPLAAVGWDGLGESEPGLR